MKPRIILLPLLVALAVGLPTSASAAGTGRALVLLNPPSDPATASARAQARAVIARHALRRAGPEVPEVGVLTVALAPGETVAELGARLARAPLFAVV